MPMSFYIGPESLRPALLVALLSVSLLISVFAYLNVYTRRRYFQMWLAAWMFYAVWLVLAYFEEDYPSPALAMVRTWALGISAVFLNWGSLTFMGQRVKQRLAGLLILFVVVWSYAGAYHMDNPLRANGPAFGVMGLSSLLAARSFFVYRLRREFAGAALLCAGFSLWGLFLMAHPFLTEQLENRAVTFVMAALLQLFIAVSMIILVLEEARKLRVSALGTAASERAARRGLESRVRSTEARYRQLFEQASDAIVVTRASDFNILELNQRARQLLGVTHASRHPGTLSSFVQLGATERRPADAVLTEVGSGQPITFVSRDGKLVNVLMERSSVEIDGEKTCQFVLKEITERFRLEQQVRQAEKLSALGQMISGVAHELNNPLAIIKGYVELMMNRPDVPERMREDLSKVANESNRAAKLVRNFLSLAHEQAPERKPVQLNDLVSTVVELRRFDSLVAHTTITLDLDPNLPEIVADPDQVQQVLLNLLNNALHAIVDCDHPGKIVLRTWTEENCAWVCIEDNGPGVPAQNQAKIFEPFFTTKAVGTGTGLGLSISHSIMTEHGGRIQYAPADLGGAAFTLQFPLPATATPRNATVAVLPSPERSSKGRVLVLDDEEALAEMVGEALGSCGHDVVVTSTPTKALEYLRKGPFDAIVSDYRMPQLNGRDFHAEVAKINPALAERILFLTGDVVCDETRSFFESIRNARLTKPFQIGKVARAVDEIVLRPAA